MIKVLAFGTFDIFHPGHEYHLKKAAKYGRLYVVVARDRTVKQVKGKFPLNREKKRLDLVQKLGYVHQAVLGNEKDMYSIVEEIKPGIICLGYDQTAFTDSLKQKLKERGLKVKVIRFKRGCKPHLYKSSKLKEKNEGRG